VNRSMSERAEGNECMDSFGKQYGYAGQIDEIRTQEFKRLEGNIVELHKLTWTPDRAVRVATLCCVYFLVMDKTLTKKMLFQMSGKLRSCDYIQYGAQFSTTKNVNLYFLPWNSRKDLKFHAQLVSAFSLHM